MRPRFSQAVGKVVVQRLRIRNVQKCGEPTPLSVTPMNPGGAFSVLNAMRPVGPGGSHDVLVQFMPFAQQKFVETLAVHCPLGRVSVDLVGMGVSPTLEVEPANKRINLGHVLASGSLPRARGVAMLVVLGVRVCSAWG